jgi:hypothetical protein
MVAKCLKRALPINNLEGKMMTDRYTKAVLTVIAACLAVIALRDLPFSRSAEAQAPIHVVLDQVGNTAFQYAFQYVAAPLPVKVQP